MAEYNQFRYIGVVYGDALKTQVKNQKDRFKTKFTLVVNSSDGKKNYFPITCYGDNAEKAALICRNGTRVAVIGEVKSLEFIDRQEGDIKIQIYFLATEVMKISRPEKKTISKKRYRDLVELSSIYGYEAPKSRKKNRNEQNDEVCNKG